MALFKYAQLSYDAGLIFYGDSKEQITESAESFRKKYPNLMSWIPDESDCKKVETAKPHYALPFILRSQDIDISFTDDFIVKLNANCFKNFLTGVSNAKKYGELYMFAPDDLGFLFVPDRIMEGIRIYNWSEHIDEVVGMLEERKILNYEGIRRGYLALREPLPFTQN